jgi:NAD(P)-dependent dehydrogenase (short-subunit alcohol dehydrogenase family)
MANSKDVVVTGVSSGIGLGTTKVLVSKGFRVFGSVRKQRAGEPFLYFSSPDR